MITPYGTEIGFVYMLKIINYAKGGVYKYDRFKRWYRFYVGYTSRIAIRYMEHIMKIRSNYLARNFPNSSKRLVFVKIVNPKPINYKYHPLEYKYKRFSHEEKKKLIISNENDLLFYVFDFKKHEVAIALKNGYIIVGDRFASRIKVNKNYIHFIDKNKGKIISKYIDNYEYWGYYDGIDIKNKTINLEKNI